MIYGYPKVGDLIAGPSIEYMHEHFHFAVVIERIEEQSDEQGRSVGYYRMLNTNGNLEWYSEDYVRNFCSYDYMHRKSWDFRENKKII